MIVRSLPQNWSPLLLMRKGVATFPHSNINPVCLSKPRKSVLGYNRQEQQSDAGITRHLVAVLSGLHAPA